MTRSFCLERIFPTRPLSFPVMTTTLSFFFSRLLILDDLRSKRTDFNKTAFPHFSSNGTKDTRPSRIGFLIEKHAAIIVKTQMRAIGPFDVIFCTDNHCLDNFAFFYGPFRFRSLHGTNDDVPHMCITPPRSAENFKTFHSLRSEERRVGKEG